MTTAEITDLLARLHNTTQITDQGTYTEVVALVRAASKAYYTTDTALIDDPTYDQLVRLIEAAEANHPDWGAGQRVTDRVAAGADIGGEYTHRVRMLSLDNVFDETTLTRFIDRITHNTKESQFTVEPKLDGLAISAHYENGHLTRLVTRGDGTRGEIVTHITGRDEIVGLPDRLAGPLANIAELEIRGEMILTAGQFEEANRRRETAGETPFANPRNAVAGSVRAQDRNYALPMTFIGYDLVDAETHGYESHSEAMAAIAAAGIQSPANLTLPDRETALAVVDGTRVADAVARIEKLRADLEFQVDGAVIKADTYTTRQQLGETSRAPRWAVAYKYPAEMALTRLLDIRLQVGRTGRVTPVAVLEPVHVGGVTVTSATLNNHHDIARKDVRIGDWVWVRRAGEVIPEVVGPELSKREAGVEPFTADPTCPRCGSELDTSEMVWRCHNRSCGKKEAIEYFASRDAMDINGLGEAVVTALLDAGLVDDVADLYSLTEGQVERLPGYGPKSAENLVTAINTSRNAGLTRVLTSLGVRHLGRRMAAKIAEAYPNMDTLLADLDDKGADALQNLEGFGKVKAVEITEGLNENRELIAKLAAAGVNMDAPTRAADTTNEGGALAGKKLLITGTVPGYTRDEAAAAAAGAGAEVATGVSKKLDAILVGANPGGSKITKAESLGIQVVDVSNEGAFEQVLSTGL